MIPVHPGTIAAFKDIRDCIAELEAIQEGAYR
jgi:hypothetical protein